MMQTKPTKECLFLIANFCRVLIVVFLFWVIFRFFNFMCRCFGTLVSIFMFVTGESPKRKNATKEYFIT